MSRYPRIIAITGATASGKSILSKGIMESLPDVRVIPSTTTKTPVSSDMPGEYEYISLAEFDRLRDKGEFITFIEFAQEKYAVRLSYVKDAVSNDRIHLRSLTPEVIPIWKKVAGNEIIFLHMEMPPEEEIWRRHLSERKTSVEKIKQRMGRDRVLEIYAKELIERGFPIHIVRAGNSVGDALANALEILERARK